MNPRQKLAQGRIETFEWYPYLAGYIYGLKQQASPGCGTAGVSMDGVIHWDPEYIDKLNVGTCAYVIVHEAMHLIFRHHKRAAALYGLAPTPLQQLAMNIAGDLAIEQTMQAMRSLRPAGAVCLGVPVPQLGVTLSYPENLDMIQYYTLIMAGVAKAQSAPKPEKSDAESDQSPPGSQQSSGQSLDRTVAQKQDGKEGSAARPGNLAATCEPGSGGSACDGVRRPYEVEDPSWQDYQEGIAASTAEVAMKQAELLSPGTVPGSLKQAIQWVLRPQPDPFDALRAATATCIAGGEGMRETTYRRMSRKQPDDMSRLRGRVYTQPSAVVIVDTSGSMGDAETKAHALEVIAAGLRKLKCIKVYCADTRIRSSSRLSNIKAFEWVGGGGTNMERALEEVERADKPTAIVLVTDACTRWPAKQTRAKVVVGLTVDSAHRQGIPSWMKVVPLFTAPPSF